MLFLLLAGMRREVGVAHIQLTPVIFRGAFRRRMEMVALPRRVLDFDTDFLRCPAMFSPFPDRDCCGVGVVFHLKWMIL